MSKYLERNRQRLEDNKRLREILLRYPKEIVVDVLLHRVGVLIPYTNEELAVDLATLHWEKRQAEISAEETTLRGESKRLLEALLLEKRPTKRNLLDGKLLLNRTRLDRLEAEHDRLWKAMEKAWAERDRAREIRRTDESTSAERSEP